MDLASLRAIKLFCQKCNLQPKSWQGQNFLIDQKVLDKIITVADLKKNDLILEVGSGFGVFPQELAKRVKKVIAVEIDKNIVRVLRDILKNYKNVEIIEGNILKIVPPKVDKIVANIPYSITGNFLRRFLEAKSKPKEMILLIQKEVAERIVAKPGEMSLLSVAVQFYSQPEIISYVSKKSFYPQPAVDSAIIKISQIGRRFNKDLSSEEIKDFFSLVRIGFSNRRKQLHNNLAVGLKIENKKIGQKISGQVKKILEDSNFNPKIRAQELCINDWLKLRKALSLSAVQY